MRLLAPSARAFEQATKDPIRAQEKILLEFLSRNKNTEYGKKYSFNKIKNIEDFRKNVPVTSYEYMRPLVDMMADGRANVLTADKPVFFGITSGTTGKPKLIPVTEYSKKKKAEVMNIWAYYVYRDHPDIFDGKVLAIISPEVKNKTKAGIPYGPEDGHAYNNLPAVVKNYYVLPYELFYEDDYDARYYCMLRLSMEESISTIATLNPSSIVLLCERIEKWAKEIISDIDKGTLKKDIVLSKTTRKKIEKKLKPNHKRAEELRKLLKEKGQLLPKDFWPKMKLIECWKGGTVKLYLKQLPQYFGNVPIRDFGVLSTEARSSIPMSDKGSSSPLAIQGNFYEFMPREDLCSAHKRYLLCDEVETGKEYFLIVTSPCGFYRYNIDDVVKVAGFYNKTPMVEFIQKGMNAISLTGEKIYECHVSDAVNAAVAELDVPLDFFAASVEMGKPDKYIFLVEFNGNPGAQLRRELLKKIEEQLCKNNSEYKDIREQQLLGHPVLKVIEKGGFQKYKAKKISEGTHDGQFKPPQLVPDTAFQINFRITEEIKID